MPFVQEAGRPAGWRFLCARGFATALVYCAFVGGSAHAATYLQGATNINKNPQETPTSVSVSLKSPVQAGDLLIAVFAANGRAQMTLPTGWTYAIQSTEAPSQAIFYKRAAGGEQSLTVTADRNPGALALQLHVYRGFSSLLGTGSAVGTGTVVSGGSVRTTEENEGLVAALITTAKDKYTDKEWSDAPGEGFTERADFKTTGSGPGGTFGLGDNLSNTPGTKEVLIQVASGSWRGQTVRFHTDDVAPATIGDMTVAPPSGSSVQLSWTAVGDDGLNGAASFYELRYATKRINSDKDFDDAIQVATVPAPAAPGTVQNVTLDGLAGSTTYFVAIRAVDEAGNRSALPSEVSFRTADAPASSAGQGTSDVNDLGPTDVDLSLPPSSCTSDRVVTVVLHAHNALNVRISNTADFADAVWMPYAEEALHSKDWTLTDGDGEKVVYAQFEGSNGIHSRVVSATVLLDVATGCHPGSEDRQASVCPSCVADFAHAIIEPYLVDASGAQTSSTPHVVILNAAEEQFAFDNENDNSFDDLVVHIKRAGALVEWHVYRRGAPLKDRLKFLITIPGWGVVDDRFAKTDLDRQPVADETIDLKRYPSLCEAGLVPHPHPGQLLQSDVSLVYFYGDDGKRHAFPNSEVMKSWYPNGAEILHVLDYQLHEIPEGKPVAFRPGSFVRFSQGFAWYFVDASSRLRSLPSILLQQLLPWMSSYYLDRSLLKDFVLGGEPLSLEECFLVLNQSPASPSACWPGNKMDVGLSEHGTEIVGDRLVLIHVPSSEGGDVVSFRLLAKDGHYLTAKEVGMSKDHPVDVFIVRDDLGSVQYVHPTEQDAIWTVHAVFTQHDVYHLYVDPHFSPSDAVVFYQPFALGHDVIAQHAPAPVSPNATFISPPLSVELLSDPFVAGAAGSLVFHVKTDGRPLKTFQPVNSSYAELVVFNRDNPYIFFRVHPHDAVIPTDGKLRFAATFPDKGIYTLFLEIKTEGVLRWIPITVEVK